MAQCLILFTGHGQSSKLFYSLCGLEKVAAVDEKDWDYFVKMTQLAFFQSATKHKQLVDSKPLPETNTTIQRIKYYQLQKNCRAYEKQL